MVLMFEDTAMSGHVLAEAQLVGTAEGEMVEEKQA